MKTSAKNQRVLEYLKALNFETQKGVAALHRAEEAAESLVSHLDRVRKDLQLAQEALREGRFVAACRYFEDVEHRCLEVLVMRRERLLLGATEARHRAERALDIYAMLKPGVSVAGDHFSWPIQGGCQCGGNGLVREPEGGLFADITPCPHCTPGQNALALGEWESCTECGGTGFEDAGGAESGPKLVACWHCNGLGYLPEFDEEAEAPEMAPCLVCGEPAPTNRPCPACKSRERMEVPE